MQVLVSDSQTPYALRGDTLTINLLIDAEAAHNVLERGPPADDPSAEAFRNFWGEKSNLRRFMDGAICEAVVWEAGSVCQKRAILSKIVTYIFNRSVSHSAAHNSYSRYIISYIMINNSVRNLVLLGA